MPTPLKVLLAEDNPQDAELLLRQLRRAGFEPQSEQVCTELDFRQRLSPDLDLILSDFEMGQFNGLRALQILQEQKLDIPLIIVSGTIGEETAVQVMRLGASDYLIKDRLARLGQAITHALDQRRMSRENQTNAEALRLAEARYRGIFENAVEGIFQVAANGRPVAANHSLARILGYSSPEQLLGEVEDLLNRLIPDPAARAKFNRTLAENGLIAGFETKLLRLDGNAIFVTINCRSIPGEEGSQRIVGTIEDTTERRKLESQLLRSQRLESVGRLAGGIAHDLNNILLPILMAPALLRETITDSDSLELLDTVEMSAQRGSEIIKQLLAFSRGTEGERKPLQVQALLKDMLAIIRGTFPKNITVQYNWPSHCSSVKGDSTQLHQVLMNLCVNARDAMPEGGLLSLELREQNVDAAFVARNQEAHVGRYLVLSVTDTGSGIPPEHLDVIFDPFFSTKALGHGTGLGLATVMGIVKSHSGFIQLESTVGKGTQFRIFLPACEETQADAHLAGHLPQPSGNGALILLVDDEQGIRKMAGRILLHQGYKVIEAEDGMAALSQYEQHKNDIRVIVADLAMPGMDGLSFMKALRNRGSKTEVMTMTGICDSSKLAELRALGVNCIMAKPFVSEALIEAVRESIARGDRNT